MKDQAKSIWRMACKDCKIKEDFPGTQRGYNEAYRRLVAHENGKKHVGRLRLIKVNRDES